MADEECTQSRQDHAVRSPHLQCEVGLVALHSFPGGDLAQLRPRRRLQGEELDLARPSTGGRRLYVQDRDLQRGSRHTVAPAQPFPHHHAGDGFADREAIGPQACDQPVERGRKDQHGGMGHVAVGGHGLLLPPSPSPGSRSRTTVRASADRTSDRASLTRTGRDRPRRGRPSGHTDPTQSAPSTRQPAGSLTLPAREPPGQWAGICAWWGATGPPSSWRPRVDLSPIGNGFHFHVT